jgi:hypothetical protein
MIKSKPLTRSNSSIAGGQPVVFSSACRPAAARIPDCRIAPPSIGRVGRCADARPVEATYRRPYSSPSCRRLFGPWLRHHKNDIFTRKSPGMSPGLKVRPLRFSKLGERKSDEISSPCRRGAWPASVPSSSAVRPPSPRW